METIKAYFALTKPRIIELLLVAAIPAMLQAQRGVEAVSDNIWLIVSTIFGGWMGAAAAHTFNNVVDYELDQKMQRTRARPLVRAKITKRNAAIFAWVMLIISVLWLGVLAHSWLAAFFVVLTNFFYVFVYTKFLKMRNAHNIVWGGLAGCMPAMVGWAVIRDNAPAGEPDRWWQAIVLFLIIFFWTPPHTWALAMKYKEDYRKAGVPMLTVTHGRAATRRHVFGYTLVLAPFAVWLGFTQVGGPIYLAASVVLNALFIRGGWQILRRTEEQAQADGYRAEKGFFRLSLYYLALHFAALAVQATLGTW